MGISVGVMREGLEIWWLSMKTWAVRQGGTQFLGPMGEGAHSSHLIIIASFSKVWSFQLLKAMLAWNAMRQGCWGDSPKVLKALCLSEIPLSSIKARMGATFTKKQQNMWTSRKGVLKCWFPTGSSNFPCENLLEMQSYSPTPTPVLLQKELQERTQQCGFKLGHQASLKLNKVWDPLFQRTQQTKRQFKMQLTVDLVLMSLKPQRIKRERRFPRVQSGLVPYMWKVQVKGVWLVQPLPAGQEITIQITKTK